MTDEELDQQANYVVAKVLTRLQDAGLPADELIREALLEIATAKIMLEEFIEAENLQDECVEFIKQTYPFEDEGDDETDPTHN